MTNPREKLLEIVRTCKAVESAMLSEHHRCEMGRDRPDPNVLLTAERELSEAANTLLFFRHELAKEEG